MPILRSGGLVDLHRFSLVRQGVPAEGPGGRGAWLHRILEFDGGLGDVASEDVLGGTVVRPDAILATSSASSLYLRGT